MAGALNIERAAVSLIKRVCFHPDGKSKFSLERFNSIADDIAEAIVSDANEDYVKRMYDDLISQVVNLYADIDNKKYPDSEAKDAALTFLEDVWKSIKEPSLMTSYIKQKKNNGGSLDFMNFMLEPLGKRFFPKIRGEYSTGNSMNIKKVARLRKSIEKYCREQHFPDHIVEDIKVLNQLENEPYLQEIWEKIKAKEGVFENLNFVKIPMLQLRLVVANAFYTNSLDETDDDGNRLYDCPDTTEAFDKSVEDRDTFETIISNLRKMRENHTLLMENPTPAKLITEKKYYDQYMVYLAKEFIITGDVDLTKFFLETGWVGKSDSEFRKQFAHACHCCRDNPNLTYYEIGDIFGVPMKNYSNAVNNIKQLLNEKFN